MGGYYDRYDLFRGDSKITPVIGVTLPVKSTDKKVLYKLGQTRLDILSQSYYGSPYYGWLIMLANPQYGGLEFNIPDRTVIRIPYPFRESLESYVSAVKLNIKLYGE